MFELHLANCAYFWVLIGIALCVIQFQHLNETRELIVSK